MFEVFLISHLLLATIAMVALMCHILPGRPEVWIFPAVAMGLWALNFLLRFRRVWEIERPNAVSITKLAGRSGGQHIMKVVVEVKQSIPIKSGQYVYLNFRSLWFRDRIQTHPFMVVWWRSSSSEKDKVPGTELTFFIEAREGLTQRLSSTEQSIRCQRLVGPYGPDLQLEKYDNVILVAEGLGIAGILSCAKELVNLKSLRSHKSEVLTRKLRIYWKLEANNQEEWVGHYFKELQKANSSVRN